MSQRSSDFDGLFEKKTDEAKANGYEVWYVECVYTDGSLMTVEIKYILDRVEWYGLD
jgi:hypothetical protein